MPRYFFALHERGESFADEEGQMLADTASARLSALHMARSIMCEQINEGALSLTAYVAITDGSGAEILRVTFGDVVDIDEQAEET